MVKKRMMMTAKQINLELVHRQNGSTIKLHPTDPLFSAEPQRRLAELHQLYDIKCLCTTEGVLMHIRHVTKTGLYFVADNPTSNMHAVSCKLATNRIGMVEGEAELPAPVESVEFRFGDTAVKLQDGKSDSKSGSRKNVYPHTRQSYLLLLTLIQNGYCNIAFSNSRGFQAFVNKVIDAKGRSIALAGSAIPVNQLISYGAGGLKIALDRAKKNKTVSFWFSYMAEVKASAGTRTISLYDHEHAGVSVIRPYSATGPHIGLAVVTEDGVKEVALQPVVGHKFVFPVFSDHGRAETSHAAAQLPDAHDEKTTYWLKVDLWGEDEGPGKLFLVEKDNSTSKRKHIPLQPA